MYCRGAFGKTSLAQLFLDVEGDISGKCKVGVVVVVVLSSKGMVGVCDAEGAYYCRNEYIWCVMAIQG